MTIANQKQVLRAANFHMSRAWERQAGGYNRVPSKHECLEHYEGPLPSVMHPMLQDDFQMEAGEDIPAHDLETLNMRAGH